MKNSNGKAQNEVKTVLIAGLFGFGAAAGLSWIASVVLEDTLKFEKLLAAVSLGVSVLSGLAAGLAAGLASKERRPLRSFSACAVTLLLSAAWGVLSGGASFTPFSAVRAALILAPAPLILTCAAAAPRRPKRRRR